MIKQRFEIRLVLNATLQLAMNKNAIGKKPEDLAIEYAERMTKTISRQFSAQLYSIQIEEVEGEWGEPI